MVIPRKISTVALLSAGALLCIHVSAQSVVPFGKGSIASEPPTYELVKDEWGGWNSKAALMQSKKLYVDEAEETVVDGLQVPGRPLPTNDWWTDIINSRFSGALWSYPQMLNTSESGVEVCFPSYWADAGKEMKSRSSVTVSASGFHAAATIAEDWHDWDVRFRLPSASGTEAIHVTAAEGMPFTWFEFESAAPELSFNSRTVDNSVTTPYPAGTFPEILARGKGRMTVKYGDDIYGIYFPHNASAEITAEGILRFPSDTEWLTVALLTEAAQLERLEQYAVSIPRDTHVEWSYDSHQGRIDTRWKVIAENLRGDAATAVLQGFLPHVWKHALAGHTLNFTGDSYQTPRGRLKMAASASGEYSYSYSFSGMLPAYATPSDEEFRPEIMKALTDKYASEGTLGADTYWGGKGLTQMALNMTFARQTGNTEAYELSKKKLREAFVNWLTYTPGENNYYLSYFRRWGGILGSAISYGSDEFNDHHFHYGYFTYAAALLCMEDPEFAADYGEVLKLIAKDYANWDRDDSRFPFMRTLDIWAGHSWAGGLGDSGNDNGNGQESTSEAMQGWGGLYLLGVALGDDEMRDAGIFGWATEARSTREYWFDVDAPRSANSGGRKAWSGKGSREGTYNYDLYPYAYNSNITCKGIGWWTWFGGDPLFMHGIQWMPISPALDYLSWDTDFVAWAYDDMMSGANSAYSHEWFEDTANSSDGSTIDALAKNDWGNVTLAYLQRANPAEAARIFDRAWEEKYHIATSVSTSHISYYTIHNTLSYGSPDTRYHADCPTAAVFNRDGVLTFMAYNPGEADLTVNFYDASGAIVKTVKAPGRTTTVFNRGEPTLQRITLSSPEGNILPAGYGTVLKTEAFDQYGAHIDADITMTLSDKAPATVTGSKLTVSDDAVNGTAFDIILTAEELSVKETFTVNPLPVPGNIRIEGAPEAIEIGNALDLSLHYSDQYGTETRVDGARWSYTTTSDLSGETSARFSPSHPGMYTVTATDGTIQASAEIFVMPALPCISRGATVISSSEENAGTASANINDGDALSRWGSDFTDNEWIYLDLGENMYISRAGILWEASYASEYEIQIAADGCPMESHTGRYAGVERTVDVPAEWTTVATVSQSQRVTDEVSTPVGATARYVRMRGLKRALPYGFSIYEMNLYGISREVSENDLLGIDFSLPEAMDEDTSVELRPTAYSRAGAIIATPEISWNADKPADFSGCSFTPRSHGEFTVTAVTPAGRSSSATVFVYESRKLASLLLSAAEVVMTEGEDAALTVGGLDRFDCAYSIDPAQLEVTAVDEDGYPAAGISYDAENSVIHADRQGTYTLHFDYNGVKATVTVRVKTFTETNLALHRPARSSGNEGDNRAEYATDGSTDTRWASAWEENQWITVDLESAYIIDRMTLVWENAYAADYHIEASLDGSDWTTVYTGRDTRGGTEHITLDAPTPARYVRLTGDRRALPAYGISLKELEVYGTGRYTEPDDPSSSIGEIPDILNTAPVLWYDLSGRQIARPSQPGIYIRRQGASATKVIITD